MSPSAERTYSGTFTFTLTGWKALALLTALLAVGAFRFTRARAALEGQGRAVLEAWIVGDLQRPLLADSTLTLAEKGEALLGVSDVRVRALEARGPFDDVHVFWLAFL